MIMSALISQCRREFGDVPKSSVAQKAGDGSTSLFNLGKFPIVEGSYVVSVGTSAKIDNTDYSLDKDNGDLLFLIQTPPSPLQVKANFKYANWRDQNWMEAINEGIDALNGKGFFRQTVRDQTSFSISARVRQYNAPSGTIEVYEIMESDNATLSGNWRPIRVNWSYQQDANQIVLGQFPTAANRAALSYLRNMRKYTATSATVDVKDDWMELVKSKAGAKFYRHMAGKIATQGNATIDEGHFSFTSLRTQANDLDNDFEKLAKSKKPTRPAVTIQNRIDTGGNAG